MSLNEVLVGHAYFDIVEDVDNDVIHHGYEKHVGVVEQERDMAIFPHGVVTYF